LQQLQLFLAHSPVEQKFHPFFFVVYEKTLYKISHIWLCKSVPLIMSGREAIVP
jgi:hypothetical protein